MINLEKVERIAINMVKRCASPLNRAMMAGHYGKIKHYRRNTKLVLSSHREEIRLALLRIMGNMKELGFPAEHVYSQDEVADWENIVIHEYVAEELESELHHAGYEFVPPPAKEVDMDFRHKLQRNEKIGDTV